MKINQAHIKELLSSIAAATLIYAAWHWSVTVPQLEINQRSLTAALRILWALLVLTFIGLSFTTATLRWCSDYCKLNPTKNANEERRHQSLGSLNISLSTLIISIGIGQIACSTWVFLRSGLNGLIYLAAGYQPPITSFELIVMVLLCALLFYWGCHGVRKLSIRYSIRPVLLFVLVTVAVVLPVALRELPREIALSSDPDQHAFWASQILRLRAVPWDQGILGIGAFGYPAGFAVLNAIWSSLSGLSAVEVVTIQSVLQFLIVICLSSACAPLLIPALTQSSKLWSDWIVALGSLCGIVFYWTVLPYGLNASGYFGEGAGRMSASFFSAVPLFTLLTFPRRSLSSGQRNLRLAVMGSATAFLITVNPITSAFNVILTSICFVTEIISRIKLGGLRAFVNPSLASIFMIALGCGSVVLSDPYYSLPLAHVVASLSGFAENASSVTRGAGSTASPLSLIVPHESLWPMLAPNQLIRFLLGDTLALEHITLSIYLIFGLILLLWLRAAPLSALKCVALTFCLALAAYGSLALPSSGDLNRPLHLVQPYLMHALMQAGASLGYFGLSVGIVSILSGLGLFGLVSLAISAILTITIPAASYASTNKRFNLAPRVKVCGTMGCVSAADRLALDFIRELGDEILAKYPLLSYAEAPKILMLGYPADLGLEKWIFPHGASRLLPLVSSLPVAFFYGRGSPSWTFQNYQSYVCQQLDIEWLKRRNIRYLFMSSQYPGCIRGRERVLAQSKVLFKKDDTIVLELF